MFREASGIQIHGGIFNAYGSSGPDKTKRIADAMALLSSRAEKGAPYDAAAREDVPKCHEHTRVAIIDGVHQWAHSREADARPLMWMYGPAGSGKTTIMQTVAERFDQEGNLAASFFFSTQATARPTDKENFVVTLVHQLSFHIPALQQHLADAFSDASILTKSLSKQLDVLVIGPLNKLAPEEIRDRCIVLIDGLDECNGEAAQRLVLAVLERFLRQVRHRVRILIASRPLAHIRAFFSRGSIREVARTISLDNDHQSDEDIRTYLISQFWSIRDEHPESQGLPPEWPSHSIIDVLVQRASGRFIYASTAMSSIANYDRHPFESLQIIIDSKIDDGARPLEESRRKDDDRLDTNTSTVAPSMQRLGGVPIPLNLPRLLTASQEAPDGSHFSGRQLQKRVLMPSSRSSTLRTSASTSVTTSSSTDTSTPPIAPPLGSVDIPSEPCRPSAYSSPSTPLQAQQVATLSSVDFDAELDAFFDGPDGNISSDFDSDSDS